MNRTTPEIRIAYIRFTPWHRFLIRLSLNRWTGWLFPESRTVDTQGAVTEPICLRDIKNVQELDDVMDLIAKQITHNFRERGMLVTIWWENEQDAIYNPLGEVGRFYANVTLPSRRFANAWKKLADRYTPEGGYL